MRDSATSRRMKDSAVARAHKYKNNQPRADRTTVMLMAIGAALAWFGIGFTIYSTLTEASPRSGDETQHAENR